MRRAREAQGKRTAYFFGATRGESHQNGVPGKSLFQPLESPLILAMEESAATSETSSSHSRYLAEA